MYPRRAVGCVYSQRHLRQLLLGQVQRVVEGPDAVLAGVRAAGQVGPEDGVVHDVDECSNAVPAFVVEPDLRTVGNVSGSANNLMFLVLVCSPAFIKKVRALFLWSGVLTLTLFLVSKPLMKPDKLSRNRSAAAP